MSHRGNCGLTIVELLVVIAIIGILLGITLPAVQQARESARCVSCQNNLKQIGLAFQLHHESHQFYPTGGWDWWEPPTYLHGTPMVGAEQGAGWGFQILPYAEGANIWVGGDATNDPQRVLNAVGAAQPLFFCPSRRAPQKLTYSDPGYLGGIPVTHALCDYAASNSEGTGIVRQYEANRAADLSDGLSTVLLAGDKRLNRVALGAWQEDDNEGYTAGWDEDTVRRTERPPAPDHRGKGDGDERFGSSHGAVFNASFADGAVHAIAYSIDPEIFRRLGQRNDGMPVEAAGF